MRLLFLSLMVGGAVAISFAKPVPGSGANHGMARPGGNPGAGAASGPVLSPESDEDAARGRSAVRGSGVVMRGGNVYLRSHGKELRVEEETQLAEGLSVDRRGKVTFKDGRQVELREGQMLTPDGAILDHPLFK